MRAIKASWTFPHHFYLPVKENFFLTLQGLELLHHIHGWLFFLSLCRARSRLRRSSKRFVLDWQFPHVGEKVRRKARCLQYKTGEQAKNNTTHNKPKQPKKTPRKLRETLRFQKVPKPLSTASRCYSKSHSNIPSDSIS